MRAVPAVWALANLQYAEADHMGLSIRGVEQFGSSPGLLPGGRGFNPAPATIPLTTPAMVFRQK